MVEAKIVDGVEAGEEVDDVEGSAAIGFRGVEPGEG